MPSYGVFHPGLLHFSLDLVAGMRATINDKQLWIYKRQGENQLLSSGLHVSALAACPPGHQTPRAGDLTDCRSSCTHQHWEELL